MPEHVLVPDFGDHSKQPLSRALSSRILLGSVSETVVRRAPVPVLLVR